MAVLSSKVPHHYGMQVLRGYAEHDPLRSTMGRRSPAFPGRLLGHVLVIGGH